MADFCKGEWLTRLVLRSWTMLRIGCERDFLLLDVAYYHDAWLNDMG